MTQTLRRFFLILFLVWCGACSAQQSAHLRISLLTCSPGDELYSTFGHSAIRIVDSSSVQDIVFNYGTFNFEEPGFYTKFIRGKLRYFVSTDYFENFKAEYEATNRGITEQVLNLTDAEKIAVQQFLLKNIREENKYYQYDFLFDNCTTRVRDIIAANKHSGIPFKAVMPAGTRFRQAIHEYLARNQKDWSKLGIDLLLGAPTDAVMSIPQSQFLPDNLMKSLDSSDKQHDLVLARNSLYPYTAPASQPPVITPVALMLLLILLFVLADFSKVPWIKTMLQGLDGLLFFFTGAIGILLLFMWFGTDHAMCKNNYNLLWAWPTHLVASFFIHHPSSWTRKYLVLTTIGLSLLIVAWFFLPQQLNHGFLLWSLLLLYRSIRKLWPTRQSK